MAPTYEKTGAIILRVFEFSETSCVVHLYTREFGKVAAIAKGARRPKSPFEGAMDTLAIVSAVLIHKSSSEALDILTEARLERRFRGAAKSLATMYAGLYIVELLRELTTHGDRQTEIFDLSVETIGRLDREFRQSAQPVPPASVGGVVLQYELSLLKMVGHAVAITRCAECADRIDGSNRVPFEIQSGGCLCSRCRQGKRSLISLSSQAWQTLQQVDASIENGSNQAPWSAEPGPHLGEVRPIMNQVLAHVAGRKLSLSPYLTQR